MVYLVSARFIMHSELTEILPGLGLGPQINGSEDIKTDLFQEEDPLLVEKSMLPTGVFAVHVYGFENLDLNFPPEHFGFYVEITVGSMTKCTSTQSPFKNGRVVWDEIKNFSLTISPKITSSVNKVTFAVVEFDKLQPKQKHKLLGKTEFHLHKLAKKQWSMETFQLQNRKKQHTGDLQLEIAFAYGVYGYGLCDQLESHQPPRYYVQQSAFPHMELSPSTSGNSSGILFVPKKVPHPNIITFKEKITNLEPEFSPYYSKTNFTPIDMKSRPYLQQKMTRLSQLYSDYTLLTTRTKRINYLKRLLQEKEVHGVMPGEQEFDSDDSLMENMGDVTQFGLAGALAQMANMTFLSGAPGADKQVSYGQSVATGSTETDGHLDMTSAVDGGETSEESPLTQQMDGQVRSFKVKVTPDHDEDDTDDEADIMASMSSRGRRAAVVLPKPSKRK